MSAESCSLCDPALAPVLAESVYWRLVLNNNQNLLGKCFLTLQRHAESVSSLTPVEWTDLHTELMRTTRMLTIAFAPDHFNYAFLQNQDRHVHMHVIPRYATPRMFGGNTFDDPDYPGHYSVPGQVRHLLAEQVEAMTHQLQEILRRVQ